VKLLWRPPAIAATVLVLATLASFGPHLAILTYQLAGARPPAALLFLCPLHHGLQDKPPSLVLRAKPFVASR
jgi:hypothetical protein